MNHALLKLPDEKKLKKLLLISKLPIRRKSIIESIIAFFESNFPGKNP